MRDARREDARARREAASWFSRLSQTSITNQSLREFRAWRRDPRNRAAYEQMEGIWNRAGGLAGDPDIEAIRRETLRRTSPRAARKPLTLRVGLALGVAAVALVAILALVRFSPQVYQSGVGEQRIVRLADGSTLRLDTDSRAVVALGPQRRDIRLERGEALFEVAHDASRPFFVHAHGAVVRAVGTVFDVRVSGADVGVVLLQGAVQVRSPAGAQVMLAPDERVQLHAGTLARPSLVDARRAVSWTERRLIFDHTPLEAAVAEVNRYTTAKVELEAPGLAAAPVNGVFETGDARTFAAAVASVFDLQVDQGPGQAIVLRRTESGAR
jgi:transmembrane sensor